jgi:hypothetical protein
MKTLRITDENLEEVISLLQNLSGLEPWIGDPQVKRVFRDKFYSALELLKGIKPVDMKAYLVKFELLTRVVVPANSTEDQIFEAAYQNMRKRMEEDFRGNLEGNLTELKEDKEQPYDSTEDYEGEYGYYSSI